MSNNNDASYVYWFKILLLILFGFFFYLLFHICTKQNAAQSARKKSPVDMSDKEFEKEHPGLFHIKKLLEEP